MIKKIIIFLVAFSVIFGCSTKQKNIISPPVQEKLIEQEKQEDFKQILLNLHNEIRKSKNIEELKIDEKLCEYAQKHTDLMARKNRLVHSSMNDLMNVDSESKMVAENIAWGQSTEKEVVSDWMSSFGHRNNMLGKHYSKVGFGMNNDKGRVYWCAVFSN
jgi:uncharacterized protein YkwD